VGCGDHRAATAQCAAVLRVKFRAGLKISCETVLAEIFEVHSDRYRDAFTLKARSHRAITTLGWLVGSVGFNRADPVACEVKTNF
jgi:hypothetical protein